MGNNLLTLPCSGNVDTPTIVAHMILLEGHEGGIALGTMVPNETTTHIDGVAESIEFPAARHRNTLPADGAIAWTIEAVEHLVGIGLPEEIPLTVECLITYRSLGHTTLCGFNTLVGEVMCVHSHASHLVDVWPLPSLGIGGRHTGHSRHLVKALRNLQRILELRFCVLFLGNGQGSKSQCHCH